MGKYREDFWELIDLGCSMPQIPIPGPPRKVITHKVQEPEGSDIAERKMMKKYSLLGKHPAQKWRVSFCYSIKLVDVNVDVELVALNDFDMKISRLSNMIFET